MKLGSLFDGSGTAPLCAAILGWEPVWASEIEPFPVKVTSKRFPRMKHLGDITRIKGGEIEPVDVIVGGSPCQDLSVAGKQAGLQDGTRSHLFYDMTRIIREMRDATNGKFPRYVVWENVPGAFSSNKGRDFHEVLKAFCALADDTCDVPEPPRGSGRAGADKLVWGNAGVIMGDNFSLAWRVLDAQFWGVPQRRRRIFLAVDLGGGRAGEILFEREGLWRDPQQSGEARKSAAAAAVGSADRSDGTGSLNGWDLQSQRLYGVDGIVNTLYSAEKSGQQNTGVVYATNENLMGFHVTQDPISGEIAPCMGATSSGTVGIAAFMGGQGNKAGGIGYSEECAPTLKAVASGTNAVPDVVYAETGVGWMNESKACETLRAASGGRIANVCVFPNYKECGIRQGVEREVVAAPYTPPKRGECVGVLASCAKNDEITNGDISPCLLARAGTGGNQLPIVGVERVYPEVTGPLMANSHPGSYTGQDAFSDMLPVVPGKPPRQYIVRRLTPLECCRLQGFPDWWVYGCEAKPVSGWWADNDTWRRVIDPHGEVPGSDSAIYKMWGNGMALPCMLYVLSGIGVTK